VCYLLLDLPLSHSSRTVLNVCLKRPEEQAQVFVRRDDDQEGIAGSGVVGQLKKGKSLMHKYIDRLEGLEDITYIKYCREFTHDNNPRPRPRAPARCLNIWPQYNKDNDQEDFARAKLMLHHPWRALTNLYYDDCDEEIKTTYYSVYRNCVVWHNHEKDSLDDEDETFSFNNAST
jgi:hypothetical protein